jgi:hypothetical protein
VGWLLKQVFVSLFVAIVVVKIAEMLFAGIGAVVKGSLFVGVWTAISTGSGMHWFSKTVRGLRQALPEDKPPSVGQKGKEKLS